MDTDFLCYQQQKTRNESNGFLESEKCNEKKYSLQKISISQFTR